MGWYVIIFFRSTLLLRSKTDLTLLKQSPNVGPPMCGIIRHSPCGKLAHSSTISDAPSAGPKHRNPKPQRSYIWVWITTWSSPPSCSSSWIPPSCRVPPRLLLTPFACHYPTFLPIQICVPASSPLPYIHQYAFYSCPSLCSLPPHLQAIPSKSNSHSLSVLFLPFPFPSL